MAPTQATVITILSELSGFDEHEIKPNSKLVADLGFDSMGLVELGQELEVAFDNAFEVPDSSVAGHMTVQQLVEEVDRLQTATK